jgi:ABC-type Mn2+/Zn2+ transport system permease subunit
MKLPTGPMIVLVAAAIFGLSFLVAAGRDRFARRRQTA